MTLRCAPWGAPGGCTAPPPTVVSWQTALLDLASDAFPVAGEEGAARDDHVDFVGAGLDSALRVVEADSDRVLTRREAGGDGGHADAAALGVVGGECAGAVEFRRRDSDEFGIHTDGGDARQIGRAGVRGDGLAAEAPDLVGRVLAFERGEVEHGEGRA